jgi:hypothetical protein
VQLLEDRSTIAAQALRNPFETILQSHCNRIAIAAQSLRNHLAITFQSL